MRLKRFVASMSLLFVVSAVYAQDTAPPPQTEDDTAPAPTPAAPTDTPEPQADAPAESKQDEKKIRLYIAAGGGAWNLDDLDSSIQTVNSALTKTTTSFSEQNHARAAIGWKRKGGKGDFRLIFNGWGEDGYSVKSQGFLAAVDTDLAIDVGIVNDALLWWTLEIDDGNLHALRTPPQWTAGAPPVGDDTNDNGFVDEGEQRYEGADLEITASTFPSLQNQLRTYDLVFGNVWGPRRFQGRWFAGLRYFNYEGNVLATAWLAPVSTGLGFTDGAFLRLLNFRQEASGLGPTGLMEARFNFFDQHLQLFINGQAAFIVENVETTSGAFVSLVIDGDSGATIEVPANLDNSQKKSTWHTGAELGVRLRLTNGLRFEASYGVVGILDAVLLPNDIRIPENVPEAPQGTSAVFNTQDLVLKGWRAGIAFQF